MKRWISLFFVPAFLVTGLGCSPSLGRYINVNSIEPVGATRDTGARAAMLRVKIGEFTDARPEKAIGEIEGRDLDPEGSVGESVRRAFERQLRTNGASVALFDAPSLSGEVTEWRVKVYPGFPASQVDASATIRIKLSDASGKILRTALYSGTVSQTHPFLSQSRIEETLGDAMAYAIKEALRDDKVISELSRG